MDKEGNTSEASRYHDLATDTYFDVKSRIPESLSGPLSHLHAYYGCLLKHKAAQKSTDGTNELKQAKVAFDQAKVAFEQVDDSDADMPTTNTLVVPMTCTRACFPELHTVEGGGDDAFLMKALIYYSLAEICHQLGQVSEAKVHAQNLVNI